jgi:hypothetical protein
MNVTYNPGTMDFFAKNGIFKNKVVTYRLIAIENFLPLLRDYKKSASVLLAKIEMAD